MISEKLYFSIGEIPILLTCDNEKLFHLLSRIIKHSLFNKTPHFTIHIDTKDASTQIFELQTPTKIRYNFNSSPKHFLGAWNGIRIISQYLALKKNILFIHGSSICKDGVGHVFYGKSGAGKTTIAKSARKRGYEVLGDDTAVLQCSDDTILIYPSPFDKLVSIKKGTKAITLKSFANIIQNKDNYMEPITLIDERFAQLKKNIATEVFAHLLKDESTAPIMREKIYKLIGKLSTIPANNLFFKKECDFFHLLPYGKQ